jgi:hypothetical protein
MSVNIGIEIIEIKGQIEEKWSKNIKKITWYFHMKIKKKHICMYFFDLITSLLKPWELGLYFQNTKNYFVFLLVSKIMNLYARHIFDIK